MKRKSWFALSFLLIFATIWLVWANLNSSDSNLKSNPNTFNYKADGKKTIFFQMVEPFSGNGSATRKFDGKKFELSIRAKIGLPHENKYYEAWLVRTKPGLDYFSLGPLDKKGDTYLLDFGTNHNLNDFEEVIITEESNTSEFDNIPETKVMQASFN